MLSISKDSFHAHPSNRTNNISRIYSITFLEKKSKHLYFKYRRFNIFFSFKILKKLVEVIFFPNSNETKTKFSPWPSTVNSVY